VEFEWDPEKAEGNLRKHRVRFAEAETVFKDEILLTTFDETLDEERYTVVGVWLTGNNSIRGLYDTWRTIRLISARKATRRECREYENRK
jgi:uncharacterized DUF497 family protein